MILCFYDISTIHFEHFEYFNLTKYFKPVNQYILYICIYVYMDLWIYLSMYICIYGFIYLCIYVYIYSHIYLFFEYLNMSPYINDNLPKGLQLFFLRLAWRHYHFKHQTGVIIHQSSIRWCQIRFSKLSHFHLQFSHFGVFDSEQCLLNLHSSSFC